MEKILAPKGMKKGIFFVLKTGLQLAFLSNSLSWMKIFDSLFLDIILDAIESVHFCVRFDSRMTCKKYFSLKIVHNIFDK